MNFEGEGNMLVSNLNQNEAISIQIHCIQVHAIDMSLNETTNITVSFSHDNPVYLVKVNLNNTINPYITCTTKTQNDYQLFMIRFFNMDGQIASKYATYLSTSFGETGVYYFLIVLTDQRTDTSNVEISLEYSEVLVEEDDTWTGSENGSEDYYGGDSAGIAGFSPLYLIGIGIFSILFSYKVNRKKAKSQKYITED